MPFGKQPAQMICRTAGKMNLFVCKGLKARGEITAVGLNTVAREPTVRGHRLKEFDHEAISP